MKLQGLICHKTQSNQSKYVILRICTQRYMYFYGMVSILSPSAVIR